MNNFAERLRSQKWASVDPVTGETGQPFVHKEPKQEYSSKDNISYCFGLHRARFGAVSPVTAPVRPPAEAPDGTLPSGDGRVFPCHLPRLILDLETYYTRDYSLDKLDTAAYVYDPRFHVHGVAVSYPDGRAEFRTDVEDLLAELRRAYGGRLERVAVVMHNAYFDYYILYRRYGIEMARVCDTMLLSRLLHGADEDHSLKALAARYGLPAKGDLDFMKGVRNPDAGQLEKLRDYAVNDATITARLADILMPLAAPHPMELWAAEHSVKMFVERPLAVDRETVATAQASLEASITAKVAATGLDETAIRSTVRFPAILGEALAKTGRRLPVKNGKKGTIAAIAKGDPEREALLADGDPDVRALMLAKAALSSAAASRGRLERLALMARHAGVGHFLHSYYRANTGRYAGADGFNIQNLKHGSEDGDVAGLIRRSIKSPAGTGLVAADASQIEARVLAYLAGQADLHDAFAKGQDVYSQFASKQFRREVRKPKKDDPPEYAAILKCYRQIGKQAILGLGYGMGVRGFIRNARSKPELADLFAKGLLDDATCAAIVYGYRDAYPEIVQFWRDCEEAARSALNGVANEVSGMLFHVKAGTLMIRLRSGRELVYPRIREGIPTYEEGEYLDRDGVMNTYTKDRPRLVYGDGFELYGGKIVENIVQAAARDLLVETMHRLEMSGMRVIHHCHDSITVAVPPCDVKAAEDRLITEWRNVPAWAEGLILDAETKKGTTLEDV